MTLVPEAIELGEQKAPEVRVVRNVHGVGIEPGTTTAEAEQEPLRREAPNPGTADS